MISRKMELLAPAGNFISLKAAVANGADAVYLGGGLFNARRSAGNFSDTELSEALAYARERGVKVYITLNTLLKDSELPEALAFASYVYECGADAVIVQDIGLARLLREHVPGLRLHASTQMTIHNTDGVKACEEMGFSRVVLSRELSLKQIETIINKCNTEIEVFVHGALCISYSGQCLLSSFIGARSGNRGMCAQPCRLPWKFSRDSIGYQKEAYLFSPKDLMGLSLLPQLQKAGVTSLKIEGRMKSPEYVATVTGIYRKYLDLLKEQNSNGYRVEEDDLERLHQIFNRGGFTATYLKGDLNFKELMYPKHPKNRGIYLGRVLDSRPDAIKVLLEKPLAMGDGIEVWDEKQNNPDILISSIVLEGGHQRFAPAGSSPWIGDMKTKVEKGSEVWRTYSKPLMEKASESYERGEARKVPIKGQLTIKKGEKASLVLMDFDGNCVESLSERETEAAVERPLSKERAAEQLQKTGDTPYLMIEVTIDTDGESTMPISAINAMRREALAALREMRIAKGLRETIRLPAVDSPVMGDVPESKALSVLFYSNPPSSMEWSKSVRRVFVPIMEREALIALRERFGGELFIWTPSIVKDGYFPKIRSDIEKIADLLDGLSVGNPGMIKAMGDSFPHIPLHADNTMNLFNSSSLLGMLKWGATSASLSTEMNLEEVMKTSANGLELEASVYGQLPLMTLEYCPGSLQGECHHRCGECNRITGFMKDRKGVVFPYIRDQRVGITRLFNQMPLFMDDVKALEKSPIKFYRLSFLNEEPLAVEAIIAWFAAKIGDPVLNPSQEALIRSLKDKGITKGHWFRGV